MGGVAVAQAALEDGHGEGVLEPPLDDPLERTRSIRRVIALVREEVECGRVDIEGDRPRRQTSTELPELDLDDLTELVTIQPRERDHVVDTVEEFRAEVLAQHGENLVAHT